MTLDQLWNMIKSKDLLPVIYKSKTKDCIVFFASEQKQRNYLLRLYLRQNNHLTISSDNGKTSLQRCNEQIDETQPENIIVNTVKKWLTDASVAFKNDPLNKAGKKKKISLSSTPTVQQAGGEGGNESEEKIIKTFLEKGVPDGEFWKDENYNPWIKPIYHKEGEIKTFILEGDWGKVQDFIWRPGGTDTQIRANVLPQPYIGDPNAPIWLLLMNPSYSAADIYDMVRCDETAKKEVIASIKSDGKRVYETDEEVNALKPYFLKKDRPEDLLERKKMMKAQLSFDSKKFYVLENEFNTICTRDEIKKGSKGGVKRTDSSCQGSYEWWNKYLLQQDICNKKHDNLKNFFVLESFPYHSENYDKTLRPKVEHFKFWVKMVVYALLSKKILLCRESIGELVINVASQIRDFDLECAKKERIFVSSSSGSFSVSTGNFFSYKTWQEIQDSKKDFKKMIIKMIENK